MCQACCAPVEDSQQARVDAGTQLGASARRELDLGECAQTLGSFPAARRRRDVNLRHVLASATAGVGDAKRHFQLVGDELRRQPSCAKRV